MSELRKKVLSEFNFLLQMEFNTKFQILANFFLDNFVLILESLLSHINANSKSLLNVGVEVKNIIISKFKSLMVNFVNENIQNMDKFNGIEKILDTFAILKEFDVSKQINDLNQIILDESNKNIKEIKEVSRKKRDFIKNII